MHPEPRDGALLFPCYSLFMSFLGYLLTAIALYLVYKGYSYYKANRPKLKGMLGEYIFKFTYLSKLPRDEYLVFHNLLINNKRGTAQTDFVILSLYGVFVIEYKNYFGRISGEPWQKYWKQFTGKREYTFQNPIKQNEVHIKSLRSVFPDVPQEHFVSVVVFGPKATLRLHGSTSRHVFVVTRDDFDSVVKGYPYQIFRKEQLLKMKDHLLYANMTDKRNIKGHIDRNKRMKKYFEFKKKTLSRK